MVKVKETWKNAKAANFSKYEVSNLGRVRNSKTGRILIPANDGEGYNHYRLSSDSGKIQLVKAHRLVAIVWIDNVYGKTMVDHINSNKQDNRVSNLRWCSAVENQNFHNVRLSREKVGRRFFYDVTDLSTGYMMERLDQKQCVEYFGITNPSAVAKRNNNTTLKKYKVKYANNY